VRRETVGHFKGEGSCTNICVLRRVLDVIDLSVDTYWLVVHRLYGLVPTEMGEVPWGPRSFRMLG
jgi:hypothetical protein